MSSVSCKELNSDLGPKGCSDGEAEWETERQMFPWKVVQIGYSSGQILCFVVIHEVN